MKSFRKVSMRNVIKTAMAVMASAALVTFPITSSAQTTAGQTSQGADQPSRAGGQQAGGQPHTVENVKELLKNLEHLDGQKVTVSGEVEERIDQTSFILESGGIFNDEIVVVMPKGKLNIQEDDEVTVTGTVRSAKFVDIESEYNWALDEETKSEIEGEDAFLIADHVDITKKDD